MDKCNLFQFANKSSIFVRGNQGPPHWEEYCPLLFLPATPSSRTLEELLSWHGALQGPSSLPCALLLELHRNKATGMCVVRGAEVPGHY